MRMLTTIKKWGNSQGIRLPLDILREAKIDKESAVNISAQGNCIVITKADPQKKRQNIMELFEGYKGEYEPNGIDWGEPVGKEVW